jgi:NhaA family Na+:H+ antiporter
VSKNQIKARPFQTVSKYFLEFVQTQQFGGILLLACTFFSIAMSNSSFGERYMHFWHTSFQVIISDTVFSKSIEFFINDGLMSIFFLLVGIEIKRELINGELSTRQKATLPLAAAFGGMIIPAFIFYFFNKGTVASAGWGIPMATDIAFALGILALVGKKVPIALKVFLTALAVVDDLGAIVVIGLFYSSGIQLFYALLSLGIIILLLILNKSKVNYTSVYIALGLVLWFTIHRMGIHATLSGVLLAFTLPTFEKHHLPSVSARLGHLLHIPVNFIIMPLFALANTCIAFGGKLFDGTPSTLIVGIMAGLFLGKPLGIVLFSYLTVKLKWATMPRGVDWNLLIGAGFLGGIGFTMSVFITLLAFSLPEMVNAAKITIVIASLLAGVVGFIWLKVSLSKRND